MNKKDKNIITKEDSETIVQAFDEPMKIQLLFKIAKKPHISSKELKDELFVKGTKIYYYLNQLSEKNVHGNAIITATEHKDETREHLIMKTYCLSSWMEEIIKTEKIFDIYEDESKNTKWHFIVVQKITIALMTQQLREFEIKSSKAIEKEITNLPIYNFGLITQKTAETMSPKFKKTFDELCDLEDQKKPLFDRLINSQYSVILSSIKII
jgi:hypothetical protein